MNSQSLNDQILCVKAKNYNVGQHQRFHYTNAFLIPSDNQLLNQIANNPNQPKTDIQEDTLQSQTSTDPGPVAPTGPVAPLSEEKKDTVTPGVGPGPWTVRAPHNRPQRPTAPMGDGFPKFGGKQGSTTSLTDVGGKRKKNRARNP